MITAVASRSGYIELGGTARSPEDVISLKNLGLQFAEMTPSNDEQFIKQIDRYNELKRSLNIYYLAHGPREGDPNDIENLEKVYLDKVKKVLPLAVRLGMHLMTVHLWLDKRFVNPDVIEFKCDLLRRIIDLASKRGIEICVENLSEHVSDLEPVFSKLPDLGMTLDLGHAQLLTNKNNSIEFIKRYHGKIKHIHMHDNRGGDSAKDDIHLPPGEGVVDFRSICTELKKVKYSRTITLELRPYEIERCLDHVKMLIQ